MIVLRILLESTNFDPRPESRLAIEPKAEFTDFLERNVLRRLDFGLIEEFSDEKVVVSHSFHGATLLNFYIFKEFLFEVLDIMRHGSIVAWTIFSNCHHRTSILFMLILWLKIRPKCTILKSSDRVLDKKFRYAILYNELMIFT